MSLKFVCYLLAVVFCGLQFFGVPRFNWLASAIGLVILATWPYSVIKMLLESNQD